MVHRRRHCATRSNVEPATMKTVDDRAFLRIKMSPVSGRDAVGMVLGKRLHALLHCIGEFS